MAESLEPPVRARAVALKDDGQADIAAPRITASGFGRNAEEIIELALRHGVRVRQDADLAEVLSALEVDSLVPLPALRAVADILAYVYAVNHRLDTQAMARLDAMRQRADTAGHGGH